MTILTFEEKLQSQIMSCVANEPDSIVNLLISADVSDKIKQAANTQEESVTLEVFITNTLYYSLEDSSIRESFLKLMPAEFLNQVPEIRVSKHPSNALCGQIASILLSYKDMKYICKSFLDTLAQDFPELASELLISDF